LKLFSAHVKSNPHRGLWALSDEIAAKLAGFDASVKRIANPGLLGHLCRLLARR